MFASPRTTPQPYQDGARQAQGSRRQVRLGSTRAAPGYSAIADEWIGIRPGTDGLFVAAIIQELLKAEQIDVDYLVRYTNAPWLVIRAPGAAEDGPVRPPTRMAIRSPRQEGRQVTSGSRPILAPRCRSFRLADGREAVAGLQLLPSDFSARLWRPSGWLRDRRRRRHHRRIAAELAHAASRRRSPSTSPGPTGSASPREDDRPAGRHACHARRLAHANGFHNLPHPARPADPARLDRLPRWLPLQGAVTRSRRLRSSSREANLATCSRRGRCRGRTWGSPPARRTCWSMPPARRNASTRPSAGRALSAHGLMHMVMPCRARRSLPIDVLFLYMANLGWNSSMDLPARWRI